MPYNQMPSLGKFGRVTDLLNTSRCFAMDELGLTSRSLYRISMIKLKGIHGSQEIGLQVMHPGDDQRCLPHSFDISLSRPEPYGEEQVFRLLGGYSGPGLHYTNLFKNTSGDSGQLLIDYDPHHGRFYLDAGTVATAAAGETLDNFVALTQRLGVSVDFSAVPYSNLIFEKEKINLLTLDPGKLIELYLISTNLTPGHWIYFESHAPDLNQSTHMSRWEGDDGKVEHIASADISNFGIFELSQLMHFYQTHLKFDLSKFEWSVEYLQKMAKREAIREKKIEPGQMMGHKSYPESLSDSFLRMVRRGVAMRKAANCKIPISIPNPQLTEMVNT